jgi:hypothetical protein
MRIGPKLKGVAFQNCEIANVAQNSDGHKFVNSKIQNYGKYGW